ncbi:hypothetical protein EUTSA_v10021642mg [Eutrema salsugineum]|uniref:Uncharacterized protein n=1 Tax=Eutrema salsugineum TaxID=72664 RepID=V4LCH6_EUTSA|nr:uncharacterized protein LOC18024675 [Eutrema salsugineum]ESQ48130.1 hypothetical protein EUTSA_v10021642mg [Eutrema salsugineum]
MRRLPPWMLAGASSDVTSTSNRTEGKSVEGKRKFEPEATKTKAEKRPRRTVKPEDRDDFEEPKKVGIRRRGKRARIAEEEAKPSIVNCKDPENFQSMSGPEDEDLTVDDLLSFAQEYVKEGEEDQTRKELSVSESVDEPNMRSSQREESIEPDQTATDMLELLLGPYFKKSQH